MGLEFKIVTSAEEMQKAFCVRNIVFVDEQRCPFALEFDGLDFSAVHFLGLDEQEPVATARIRWVEGAVKVERVAVRRQWRGSGAGREFFRFVMDHIESLGPAKIKMHSQAYVTGFYEKFGFVARGEMFSEAGIDHYYMEKLP